MALPGLRNYGREDVVASAQYPDRARTNTSNFTYGSHLVKMPPPSNNNRNGSNSKPWSAGANAAGGSTNNIPMMTNAGPDPAMSRRMDMLEQRSSQSDNNTRNLLEQNMKLRQDIMLELKKTEHALQDERSQRSRMASTMQQMQSQMQEMSVRLMRAEETSKSNKAALQQLITHTKNVERAVTVGQQDIMAKKDNQAQKLQELQQRHSELQSGRESSDRMVYSLRDDLGDANSKIATLGIELKDIKATLALQSQMFDNNSRLRLKEGEPSAKGTRMSETQRAAIEAKVLQLQQAIIDVNSKLNREMKDREADEGTINNRLRDMQEDISEARKRHERGLKHLEAATREASGISEGDKQNINMQISAVHTELKGHIEDRDAEMRQSVLGRLDDLEKTVKTELKTRKNNDKDLQSALQAHEAQLKTYVDESVDACTKMVMNDHATLRSRIHEMGDNRNSMETDMSVMRAILNEGLEKQSAEAAAREKLLEARLEDMNDRLRLGMNKMQAAVGSKKNSSGRRGSTAKSPKRNNLVMASDGGDEMDDAMAKGIREDVASQIADVRQEIADVRGQCRRHQDEVDAKLKQHTQAGEEASTILGDKIHQKMDSVAFTQERIKKQLNSLQDKVQYTPTELSDLRDRVDECERQLGEKKNKVPTAKVAKEDVDDLRKDVDYIMGKTDKSHIVKGVPSLVQLQKDQDSLKADVRTNSEGVTKLKTKMDEKFFKIRQEFTAADDSLKKDLASHDKRLTSLKEKTKSRQPSIADITSPYNNDDEGNE